MSDVQDITSNNLNQVPTIAIEALALYDAGLCLIPIKEDGTKRPGLSSWAEYHNERPTREQTWEWFHHTHAVAVVGGASSGWLEILDFDLREIYQAFLLRAEEMGLGELVSRIRAGYEEQSPKGMHLLYRVQWLSEDLKKRGNKKLAVRPAIEKETVKTLIETKGQGGYCIVAPSCGRTHENGHPYILTSGGATSIITISEEEHDDILAIARSLDERPAKDPDITPLRLVSKAEGQQNGSTPGDRPGDQFNAEKTWEDVLRPAGWTPVFTRGEETYWRRPGKDRGHSATTNYHGSDLLYVFTSSSEFEPERGYGKFSAYTLLYHGGDFSAAGKALVAEKQINVPHLNLSPRPESGSKTPDVQTDTHKRPDLPLVQVNNRQLRVSAGNALAALAARNIPPSVFVQNAKLVRVGTDEYDLPLIAPMTESAMQGELTHAANFITLKYNAKEKVSTQTAVSPHKDIAHYILSLPQWPMSFPPLLGVTTTPGLRPDGSIFSQPGYDAPTRLYYRPPTGFTLPEIATQPSAAEVQSARNYLLEELFADFPFCEVADRANMLACLLTPVVRPAIAGNVPLCLLDKPTPGSGASLLSDLVALIATGQPGAKSPTPAAGQGAEDEWRKNITAILLNGTSVVIWDNVEEGLGSRALSTVLTTPLWTDRVLGGSQKPTLRVRCSWIATGNNIRLTGDLARRAYRVRIDANQERPWTREDFRHAELLTWVGQNRDALLAAILTLARAWFAAGCPAANTPRMGSFEDWTRIVGGILAHAGVHGFLDNLEDVYDSVDDDGPQWTTFLSTWFETFGETTRTVGDFVLLASPELIDAIPDSVGFDPDKLRGSKIRLGLSLKKRIGRIHGGYKLECPRSTGYKASTRWQVIPQAK